MDQSELSKVNHEAWEAKAYEAWIKEWGSPEGAAEPLVINPGYKVRRFLPHLGNVKGKRIGNPLGSNGRLAVAFALLGADVTVFDISESNKRFALELAECAKVKIDYVVGDFISLPALNYQEQFDFVVLELGVLHYFLDLNPLLKKLFSILIKGGDLVINEFHPLMKKALAVKNDDLKVVGSYFSSEPEEADVAYQSILKDDQTLPRCLLKRWTLGEIVTAFAQSPFQIQLLEELPDWNCDQLPGMFTIVAKK